MPFFFSPNYEICDKITKQSIQNSTKISTSLKRQKIYFVVKYFFSFFLHCITNFFQAKLSGRYFPGPSWWKQEDTYTQADFCINKITSFWTDTCTFSLNFLCPTCGPNRDFTEDSTPSIINILHCSRTNKVTLLIHFPRGTESFITFHPYFFPGPKKDC